MKFPFISNTICLSNSSHTDPKFPRAVIKITKVKLDFYCFGCFTNMPVSIKKLFSVYKKKTFLLEIIRACKNKFDSTFVSLETIHI